MRLKTIADGRSVNGPQTPKIVDRLRSQNDLKAHSGQIIAKTGANSKLACFIDDDPVMTQEFGTLIKNLQKRGFKFVGSTIVYAHMQATGMVNDHAVTCFRRKEITETYHRTERRDS